MAKRKKIKKKIKKNLGKSGTMYTFMIKYFKDKLSYPSKPNVLVVVKIPGIREIRENISLVLKGYLKLGL